MLAREINDNVWKRPVGDVMGPLKYNETTKKGGLAERMFVRRLRPE